MTTRDLQRALAAAGFDPGPIDGIHGPKTDAAVVAFKAAQGLRARPYVGPLTLEALGLAPDLSHDVPWMNEAAKHIGLHEHRDHGVLSRFLRSDGKALGDPRKLPWCGDFVDTCLRLTLPEEPRKDKLAQNPYLARNWMLFGKDSPPRFGAVAVFWRGSYHGISGHVGFAVAWDAARRRIKVRGGNQRNSVSDVWLDSDRMLGCRAPLTFGDLPVLPGLSSAGAAVSRNEA
ncbi:NlpC/P60 family protein [Alteriqipengyuania lutimaris]|uniref:TIGR02594 family protein n=1 Tax=Alteriqipengyuania lutimaris TaxID=1538146 RepID=A0A395LJ95_9SPHN|nr:peptidoglycan-binding protein [Alteriqipengyuania lutimaris]MBB3034068.1 uncharacterized protein (TIGR02594 family) [Alteriqipengyuania lutimaris]RDS76992.1 TIGR02594 family protein [Alteriqipengyuania lutimaris]